MQDEIVEEPGSHEPSEFHKTPKKAAASGWAHEFERVASLVGGRIALGLGRALGLTRHPRVRGGRAVVVVSAADPEP